MRPMKNINHDNDEFEYHIKHHEEYGITIVVESSCPQCGNDVIFNGEITENVQFVGYEVDSDGNEVCGIDDGQIEIDYLSCGKCGHTVVDN
jgi:ribosomal protein S27AE